MTAAHIKSTIRMVIASFAAGASAMALVGLVAPVAFKGGLSMREAVASQFEQQAPLIEPLDVAAVEAQLAEADQLLEAARATTDDNVGRLAALSN